MEYPINIAQAHNLNQRILNLPQSIFNKISQIDNLNGKWEGGANFSPQILRKLKKSALVTSAGASTRIEGSRLTDSEVRALVSGIRISTGQDRDADEVRGYYEAATFIHNQYNDIALSENHLKEIHQILVKYSAKDQFHKGNYKHLANDVVAKDPSGKEIGVVFKTMPPLMTPSAMTELVDWLASACNERKFHPLLITAGFIVEFLRIHPFVDGNGRMSRLLTDLLMLKQGYSYVSYVSMEKIIEDNKAEYYVALRKSQESFSTDNETILVWVDFFLDICLEQAKLATELMSTERLAKDLSESQSKVLSIAQALKTFTVKDIVSRTDIPRPTIRQALEKLLALGLIESFGFGRGSGYKVKYQEESSETRE